ncbi:hypothetical protein ACUHMQ_19560 [Chitinimonas sp. PSY-7]|uniref:hypothetical protein n=1 Tax=Chitinimonas sp. PSY-7 TaxID=3459088 RepID=UPI004040316C
MKTQLRVVVGVVLVSVIAWLVWPAGRADIPVVQPSAQRSAVQKTAAVPSSGLFASSQSLPYVPTSDWTQPAQRITALRNVLAGRRSLLDLRDEVRKSCQQGCENWPEGDLAALKPQEASLLRRALAEQPAIDQSVANLVQDARQPMSDRLARIIAARDAVAGREVTQVLYGEEQARLAFHAAAQDFITKQAASIPSEDRQRALDDLRRQHYGSYFDRLSAEEGPEQHLYWALAAAEAGLPAEKRTDVRLKMRTDYLGVKLAQQLAEQEADDARHLQQAQGYQTARTDLETEIRRRGNPDQDPVLATELQDRLGELRLKWFP